MHARKFSVNLYFLKSVICKHALIKMYIGIEYTYLVRESITIKPYLLFRDRTIFLNFVSEN